MATTITMPKLGLTMNSGSVQQWKKKVGDVVKKGELLYVVATDKLTVDVESPADGVLLAITVKEGEEVPVGTPIALIGAEGERAGEGEQEQSKNPMEQAPSQPPAKLTGAGARPCSPKAKKLAREKVVDLSSRERAPRAGSWPGTSWRPIEGLRRPLLPRRWRPRRGFRWSPSTETSG